MRLFHIFMRDPTGAVLNARNCLFRSSCARQEGKMTSFYKVFIYLLATYATDDIIDEAEMDIINFKQSANQSAV